MGKANRENTQKVLNRKKIKNYFLNKQFSIISSLIMLVLSASACFGAYFYLKVKLHLIIGYSSSIFLAVLGLIFLIIHIAKKTITDKKFDLILETETETLFNDSFKKLCIKNEDLQNMKYIKFVTPAFKSRKITIKIGKDNKPRYTNYTCVKFFFSNDKIMAHTFSYDILSGKKSLENTIETRYSYISSFGYKSFTNICKDYNRNENIIDGSDFVISILGSEKFSFEIEASNFGNIKIYEDKKNVEKINIIIPLFRERIEANNKI